MSPPVIAAVSPSTGPVTISATNPPSGKPKNVGSQRNALRFQLVGGAVVLLVGSA